MKKTIVMLLLSVSVLGAGFADDGGTKYLEDWSYGNIYVTEPNKEIALESEFLYVNQKRHTVRALFDFKNLTTQKRKVPCAFPIVITIPYEFDGTQIVTSDFRAVYNLTALNLAFGRQTQPVRDEGQAFKTIPVNPLEADKKLRVIPYAEYKKQLDEFYGENVFHKDKNKTVYEGVNILLNGKKVPITHVGIETNVVQESQMKIPEKWGGQPVYNGEITLKLHFYHELEFPASSSSVVDITYATDTDKGAKRGEAYKSVYDISTGGTWAGSIKNFVLLTDDEVTMHNSVAQFERKSLFGFGSYSYDAGTILCARNYKPSAREYFEFTGYTYDDEMGWAFMQNREKQDFVRNISASSFLDGSFKITDEKSSSYKPECSFDGEFLNGWVEGAKGDGIGEWIEFTLTSTVFGPFMTNGLTRNYTDKQESWVEDSVVLSDIHDRKELTWAKNNRIKTMTLENVKTHEKRKLNLVDLYAGFRLDDRETETRWLSANANKNPCILLPGTYRLSIDSVYKGTKWSDTVLGEVWFYDLGKTFGAVAADELKSGKPFITAEVEKLLFRFSDYTEGNVKYMEEEFINLAR